MALRVKAFRHVHDLSVLTQNSERRGSLVSRVTSDVDTISQFLQFGGLHAVLSVGQLLVATILMAIYSWQLTLLVWLCFVPLLLGARFFQRRLSAAYARSASGSATCSARSPRPSSAPRPSGRTRSSGAPQDRIDAAIEAHRRRRDRARRPGSRSPSASGVLTLRADHRRRRRRGHLARRARADHASASCSPSCSWSSCSPARCRRDRGPQRAAERRRRLAPGDRRPRDAGRRRRPGRGRPAPAARPDHRAVRPRRLRLPGRATGAARHRPHPRAEHPGRGRRRDRLGQDDLRQAADPADGPASRAGCWSTAWTCARSASRSLRERVVLVPQEGFLFDGHVLDNMRFSRPDASRRRRCGSR